MEPPKEILERSGTPTPKKKPEAEPEEPTAEAEVEETPEPATSNLIDAAKK